jgi:hypothetical protein
VILEFVSNALAAILNAGVSLLPTSTWAPDGSGVTSVFAYVRGLNTYFPVDVLVVLITLVFFFAHSTLAFDAAMWIYRHLPFVGGGTS